MSNTPKIRRRQFLAGAAAAGPVLGLTAARGASAAEAARPSVPATSPVVGETRPVTADVPRLTVGRTGSDFMVDCLKSLDIQYVASCPGSTFRGLQESIVNYGKNTKPEFITCLHEEASVAMAHGYAKIAGKPMATMVHGVVGLQHAAMAIYNCFCDQVPTIVLAGNVGAGTDRRPGTGVEWPHSAHDQAIIVRDYVKWDDQAENLQDFAEGLVRGYDLATAAPMGPVLAVIDAEQQEEEIPPHEKLFIPKLRVRSQPAGDPNAVAEAAKLLAAAENPVIVTSRYTRSAAGPKLLIQLAETLQAAVVDERFRMNMPNRHPLNHNERAGAALRQAATRAQFFAGPPETSRPLAFSAPDRREAQRGLCARARACETGPGRLAAGENQQLVKVAACRYGARGVGRTVAAFLAKCGGKSGLPWTRCQVTPGRREPTESATENKPPKRQQ